MEMATRDGIANKTVACNIDATVLFVARNTAAIDTSPEISKNSAL